MPTAEDAQTRGESGGGVEGYKALREACRDVEQLVDVVWVSGTRRFLCSVAWLEEHLLMRG